MNSPHSTPVGVALVGAGRIARMFHLPILAAMEGVALVAIAEPDDGAMAQASQLAIQAAPLHGLDDVLARDDVELVVLTTPTGVHAEQAIQVLQSGRAVWIEKPIAATATDAQRVLTAWNQTKAVGAVGLVFRCHPQVVRAKSMVSQGRLGRIVAVSSTVCSSPRELPAWKRTTATGGGALLDLATHHVDLIRFLLDTEIGAVAAATRSVETEDDTVSMLARTELGAVASITASARARQNDRLEILGEEATLVIDRFGARQVQFVESAASSGRSERLRMLPRVTASAVGGIRAVVAPSPEPSFTAALQATVNAVRGHGEPAASIYDGAVAAMVTDAAARAAMSGQWVDVPAVHNQPASSAEQHDAS